MRRPSRGRRVWHAPLVRAGNSLMLLAASGPSPPRGGPAAGRGAPPLSFSEGPQILGPRLCRSVAPLASSLWITLPESWTTSATPERVRQRTHIKMLVMTVIQETLSQGAHVHRATEGLWITCGKLAETHWGSPGAAVRIACIGAYLVQPPNFAKRPVDGQNIEARYGEGDRPRTVGSLVGGDRRTG